MSPFSKIVSTALLTSTAISTSAFAQAAPAADASAADINTIIVTGTRTTGMRAADSPAPIQIIGAQAMQAVGQQDLTQVLAQSLPSLNFSSWGEDSGNLVLAAALRGLNPNDTLVLVNGKRRHFTSNLAVIAGSPYSGAATTDLSFIPTNSISRIEVLQDGASAQYGSDAIAGVINIILKDQSSGGSFSVTGGQYYKGDGETVSTALNMGFKLGERGFVNLTGEYKFHNYAQRGTCDYRFFTPDCQLTSSFRGVSSADYDRVRAGLLADPSYPRVNRILSDAKYSIYNVVFNAGYELTDSVEGYAFGSYGNRVAYSPQNYRDGARISGTTSNGATVYPLPAGFTPLEAVREEDFSLTGGFKGDLSGWNWDISLTYGRDSSARYTLDSVNPSLYAEIQAANVSPVSPQRDFYDGTLTNDEWALESGVTKEFEIGLAKPVTLAFGGQYRRDSYGITQGEFGSYYKGGPQGYNGFGPTDASVNRRKAYAGYVDLAVDPVSGLHLDFAGRYEHYSDFGNVWTGKATARYDFSPALALRGTVSNGFRAPTLAEAYFSQVTTGPGFAFGQFPSNSAAAVGLGFGQLQPEKSTSFSAGFVAHPTNNLQLTVDAYQITLKKRIMPSSGSLGFDASYAPNGGVVSQPVLDALIASGVSLVDATSYAGITIFSNGADTRTRGVEATLNYASDFGDAGRVNWTLGLNYNTTKLLKMYPLPAAVLNEDYGQTSLLGAYSRTALTDATPKVKAIANALWTWGRFSLNLRETVYGPASQAASFSGTGAGANATIIRIGTTAITDLNLGYKITRSIRLDAGANNLFNKKAPLVPNLMDGDRLRPADGFRVLNAPVKFTPWGINGGYYYARATFTF